VSDRCVRDEIDAAKVEALVAVLRTALPKLVADAFAAFKAEKQNRESQSDNSPIQIH